MHIKAYLLFLFFIQTSIVYGNSSELDSLIQRIELTNDNISKCDLFNEIASKYLYSNPSEAIFYANKSFQLSLRNNYDEGLATSYLIQGKANEELNMFDAALNNLFSALIIQKHLNNETEIAEINYRLGRICKTTGNYEIAIDYCFNALRISETQEDYIRIYRIYNTVGSIYKYLDDNDKALEYYFKSLDIQKQYRNGGESANIYNYIGIVYNRLGRYDEALKYYTKSLEIRRANNDSSGFSTLFNNIAVVFIEQEKWDSAFLYLGKSQAICEKEGDQITLMHVYNSIGEYYYINKNFTEALNYANKSISIAQRLKLSLAISENYELLKNIYVAQGQFEKALDYQNRYAQLSDSIFNQEKSMRIAQSAILYENELKQAEHDLKDQRNRFINIISYGVLLFFVAISFFIYRSLKSKMKQNKLKRINLEMEKKKLNVDLDTKNSELIRNTIHLAEKNELLIDLRKTLHRLKSNMKDENKPHIQSVLNDLKVSCNNTIWDEFEVRFIDVHNDFYKNLTSEFSDLTQNELRLAAFLKLNMNTKEISMITRQSTHSITVARTRLRKKLNLSNTDINFSSFLNKY